MVFHSVYGLLTVPIFTSKNSYETTGYIKREVYICINVLGLYNYWYCFMDALTKWPGSVCNSRTLSFFYQKADERKNIFILKSIFDDEIPVTFCLHGEQASPLLIFLMKEYPMGSKNDRKNHLVTNYHVVKLLSQTILVGQKVYLGACRDLRISTNFFYDNLYFA